MERNILDLRPNCNLVMDIDMIWAVDIYSDVSKDKVSWEVRIFSQGVSDGYILKCNDKESAEALFKTITDKMNQ
jgi:hypothetical protein